MNRKPIGTLIALLAGLAFTQQPISAVADSAASDGKAPPPQVDGSWLKEKVRLHSKKTTTTHDRTTHKKNRVTGKGLGSHKKPVVRPPQTLTELYSQMQTNDLLQRRLNEGICSRLPDGTIQGPSRCEEYMNKYHPIRPPVQQVIDTLRQQVQEQTIDIPFPKLTVKVQPAVRTLVNLDTIVYTDKQQSTTLTVPVLGTPVTVVGHPVSYTWHFGDGSPDVTTTTPGSPYPSKEITHKYLRRGDVWLSVTANYAATFTVTGQTQAIQGTAPVTGPETPLEVREAVPVLVDPSR